MELTSPAIIEAASGGHSVALANKSGSKPDTVVAIIETMKLMNPVHAGVSGKVSSIEPQNAEPVDANAILMRVALR